MKRYVTFALLLALAALPTTGARGALPLQTDARNDPDITGPISLSDKQCSTAQERVTGQLVAYTRTCIRLYEFNPNQETDLQRNYGVAWLQVNVNAENGWCAKNVRTDLKIPSGVQIHKRNPIALRTSSEPKVVTHKLATTAAGNGLEKATLRQSYVFYPRKAERLLVNEGATQRLSWTGNSDRRLFFQTGAVFSWNVLDSPGEFRSALGFRFEKGSC